MASSSASGQTTTRPQVFINFRGLDVRGGLISFLEPALKNENINVYIDEREARGEHLSYLFRRIEESTMALAIFSENYASSRFCLDELAKINERVGKGKLIVIPIFYKVSISSVKSRSGNFGDQYRLLKREHKVRDPKKVQEWKDALLSVPKHFCLSISEFSDMTDKDFVDKIVREVKRSLGVNNRGQPEAIQERQQPQEIVIPQPQAVQRQQPQAVQIQHAVVNPQGCMFSVRQLKISGSHNARYWTFTSISEFPKEAAIEVAKMRECYYLDVCGKLDTRELAQGTRYEVVFVVKVEDNSKLDNPATAQLMVPENELQERQLQFVDLARNEWVEIQAGVFVAQPHKEKIEFYLQQHKPKQLMTGLVVKGAIVRPME